MRMSKTDESIVRLKVLSRDEGRLLKRRCEFGQHPFGPVLAMFPALATVTADVAQAITDAAGANKAASLGRAQATLQPLTTATRDAAAAGGAATLPLARAFWSAYLAKGGLDQLFELFDVSKMVEVEASVLDCVLALQALVAADWETGAAIKAWIPSRPGHVLHAYAVFNDYGDELGTGICTRLVFVCVVARALGVVRAPVAGCEPPVEVHPKKLRSGKSWFPHTIAPPVVPDRRRLSPSCVQLARRWSCSHCYCHNLPRPSRRRAEHATSSSAARRRRGWRTSSPPVASRKLRTYLPHDRRSCRRCWLNQRPSQMRWDFLNRTLRSLMRPWCDLWPAPRHFSASARRQANRCAFPLPAAFVFALLASCAYVASPWISAIATVLSTMYLRFIAAVMRASVSGSHTVFGFAVVARFVLVGGRVDILGWQMVCAHGVVACAAVAAVFPSETCRSV